MQPVLKRYGLLEAVLGVYHVLTGVNVSVKVDYPVHFLTKQRVMAMPFD